MNINVKFLKLNPPIFSTKYVGREKQCREESALCFNLANRGASGGLYRKEYANVK